MSLVATKNESLRRSAGWLYFCPSGDVAQLGERGVRNAEVEGSIPFVSTTKTQADGSSSALFFPHGLASRRGCHVPVTSSAGQAGNPRDEKSRVKKPQRPRLLFNIRATLDFSQPLSPVVAARSSPVPRAPVWPARACDCRPRLAVASGRPAFD